MKTFRIRGWGPILPGCSGTPRTPANQQSASGVRVPTPYGAVSTLGIAVFVPGSSELYMYESIFDPEMGPYPPWVVLALRIYYHE